MKMYICIYAHHAAHFYGGAFISLSLLLQWRSRTKLQGKGKIIWAPNFGKTFVHFYFGFFLPGRLPKMAMGRFILTLPPPSSITGVNYELRPTHFQFQLFVYFFIITNNIVKCSLWTNRTHWLLMLLNGGDPESHCFNQNIYDIDHLITISLFPSPD